MSTPQAGSGGILEQTGGFLVVSVTWIAVAVFAVALCWVFSADKWWRRK